MSEQSEHLAAAAELEFKQFGTDPLTSKLLKTEDGVHYAIELPNGGRTVIKMHRGNPAEVVVNGFTIEALLDIVLDTLTQQDEKVPSPYNGYAITGVKLALDGLAARMNERLGTGIFGTDLAEATLDNLTEPSKEVVNAIKLYKRSSIAAGAQILISQAFEKFEEQPDFTKVYHNLDEVQAARLENRFVQPEYDPSIPEELRNLFADSSKEFEEILLRNGQTALASISANMLAHVRMQHEIARAQKQAEAELANLKAKAENEADAENETAGNVDQPDPAVEAPATQADTSNNESN